MIEVVWEFLVKPQHLREFEREYSAEGPWARLFRRSAAYRGTRLARDRENPQRFLTTDTWDDFAAYENFRREGAEEYRKIDNSFERLTESERCLGIFEVL